MTVICVLVACLFPGAGYDTVLATAFGLPGLRFKPGTQAPAGSAFSQARKLLGEQVMKRAFELDAERPDGELGITVAWKGLEVTALDGTTMELARNGVLEDAFGTPRTARGRCCGRRARPHRHRPVDRRRARRLPRRRERPGRPARGHVRGRDAEPRRPRVLLHGPVAAVLRHGADLAWRVKNGAKSVPFRTVRALPDGSELVMLHESDGMRTRRRRDTGNPQAARLPDTAARLVTFTVTARTRSGRTKTTLLRVLTTLLDHEVFPARQIAVLYSERWQVEIAFLHLKRTVRGARRALRGQSPELARQEARALLLIHNMTATAAARAAAAAGTSPRLIPFTGVSP